MRCLVLLVAAGALLAAVCLVPHLQPGARDAEARRNQPESSQQAEMATIGQADTGLNNQRFVDNGDGTVTDMRSGLVWLKHADCFDTRTWKEAKELAGALAQGELCEDMLLEDGSTPGDWRLPTIREIMTLPMIEFFNPALTNAQGTGKWSEGDAFLGVSSQYYWSSTRLEGDNAWYMYLYNGVLGISETSQRYSVWPVKGSMHDVWHVGQ